MLCPSCNSPDAYVGFSSIECVNTECAHFSQSWLSEVYRSQTRVSEPQVRIPDLEMLKGSFGEFDDMTRARDRLCDPPHGYFTYCYALTEATRGFASSEIRFWSRFTVGDGDCIDGWVTPEGYRIYVNITKLKSEYQLLLGRVYAMP